MSLTAVKDFIYLGIVVLTVGVSWGMFSTRLDAVEKKADKVEQIQSDIAVIKEKISNMERLLLQER